MENEALQELGKQARLAIVKKCNEIGGVHIGGSFSAVDFLICYYATLKSQLIETEQKKFYEGSLAHGPLFIMSKGHCYISQLAALDAVFYGTKYIDAYFSKNSEFFGHPKISATNWHLNVSSGSLGQGIVFANGLALSLKLKKSSQSVVTVIGDGELNEGAVYEAINFAAHHKLPHWIILDNNNQMSLGSSSDILSTGSLMGHCNTIDMPYYNIDGHDYGQLVKILEQTVFSFKNNVAGGFIDLHTIKGKGVSFMERASKWHHRRFRDGEYEAAMSELSLEQVNEK